MAKYPWLNLALVLFAVFTGVTWQILDSAHAPHAWLAIPWGAVLGYLAVYIMDSGQRAARRT